MNWKKSIIYMILISVAGSCIGVFLLQELALAGIRGQSLNIMLLSIGLAASIVAMLCLMAFFRFQIQKGYGNKHENYLISLGRITLNAVIIVSCFVVISLLFGLLSMLLYHMLRNTMTLNQIKGVLNWTISAISIVILPFFVSVFWSAMKSKDGFWKAFVSGIRCNGKKYLKLLITIFLLFALGLLISIGFYYVPNMILLQILKSVLLSALGTVGLFLTDRICESEIYESVKVERENEKELA